MSSYTLKLKDVVRLTGGSVSFDTGVAVLTGGNLGITRYPIFDEAYRPTLTGKIIDRYWNDEIAHESVDLFQMRMRVTLNEVMPYFNKLYLADKMAFDPLSTVDLRTVGTGEGTQTTSTLAEGVQQVSATGESSQASASASGSRAVNSQTPQTMLRGNGDYATSGADNTSKSTVDGSGSEANESESSTNDTTEGTQGTTDSTDSHTSGYQGSATDLIVKYRESLIEIDRMVLDSLGDLFMLTWGTSDDYTEGWAQSWL